MYYTLAAPDKGCSSLSSELSFLWPCRAQSFAERLRLGIAVIHGEAQDAESDQVDGRHSPPTVKTTGAIHPSMEIPCNASTHAHIQNNNAWFKYRRAHCFCLFAVLIPKEKPPITVVGDVGGRIAIIVVRACSVLCFEHMWKSQLTNENFLTLESNSMFVVSSYERALCYFNRLNAES